MTLSSCSKAALLKVVKTHRVTVLFSAPQGVSVQTFTGHQALHARTNQGAPRGQHSPCFQGGSSLLGDSWSVKLTQCVACGKTEVISTRGSLLNTLTTDKFFQSELNLGKPRKVSCTPVQNKVCRKYTGVKNKAMEAVLCVISIPESNGSWKVLFKEC